MTAPWMPPLPEIQLLGGVPDVERAMRQAQADAARAALEQAAKVCEAEESRLWRAYKGHGLPSEKGNPHTEGASDQCAVLADAIRALAKEITP